MPEDAGQGAFAGALTFWNTAITSASSGQLIAVMSLPVCLFGLRIDRIENVSW
jgi:hypothetical protein